MILHILKMSKSFFPHCISHPKTHKLKQISYLAVFLYIYRHCLQFWKQLLKFSWYFLKVGSRKNELNEFCCSGPNFQYVIIDQYLPGLSEAAHSGRVQSHDEGEEAVEVFLSFTAVAKQKV